MINNKRILVEAESLSDTTNQLIKSGQWQAAYNNTTSLDEKEAILDSFIDKKFNNRITDEKIKTYIKSTIEDLGFQESTNPILAYINIMLSKNIPIKLDYLTAVIDLFSDGFIEKELTDKQSILYNNELYNVNVIDFEFIIKAWVLLSDERRIVNRYITIDEFKNKYSSDITKLRDSIIYDNGHIRSAAGVKKQLIKLQNGVKNKTITRTFRNNNEDKRFLQGLETKLRDRQVIQDIADHFDVDMD